MAVETDGLVIDEARFPGRQGRLVFAYLVAEQGRPVPRDELAEALWGDAPPPTWDKALTVIVSKLRSLLADRIDGANALTSAFGCIRLDLPEGTWVDVLAAATAIQDAEDALASGDLENAKAAAELAASLVRQTFLPGEEGTWVDEKRRELADIRSRALIALADACLRSGDAPAAAKWAEQTIALAPFRETGYRRLMEAHVAAGNRAEALQVYEHCRQLLADELGTYPSPETESVYRELLEAPSAHEALHPDGAVNGDREPEPPRAVERGAPARTGRRRLAVVLVCVAIATAGAGAATAVVLRHGASGGPAIVSVSADSVGVFNAGTGRLIAQAAVKTGPSALAVGEGAIWSANLDDDSVSEIDPGTNASIQTVPVGKGPDSVAVGGGFVWVANGLGGTVSKVDPRIGRVVHTIPVGNGPSGIAFGEGAVWVANATDRTVTQIDPDTGHSRVLPAGAGADGIAVGDGAVWVTSESAGTLTRIDPRAGIVTPPVHTGHGASAVTVGAGGVWVANTLDGTVSRVDPTSNNVLATTGVGAGPTGLAVTDDGKAVLVTSELTGSVWRVDGKSARPILTTSSRPQAVATRGGAIYVAVRTSGLSHRGGVLTVLTHTPIGSIDPAVVYAGAPASALLVTNDGLVAFNREGGSAGTRLVSDLATEIPTPTDAGTTYTFRIRRGIRYSNGAPLRPEDFRRGIERSVMAYALSGAGTGFYFSSIVGYKACSEHPKGCDLSNGIVAGPATNTVTFHLNRPDKDFLAQLALQSADAVPAATPFKARLPLPATGPYMFASADTKHRVRLVRNPRFHEWYRAAQPDGYPDEIVLRVGLVASAQRRAAERGSADVALDAGNSDEGLDTFPPADLFARLRTRYASQLRVDPALETFYVFLNTQVPPFDDVRVRRAVNYAVDRNRMDDVRGGPELERPSCQVLPPSLDGYRPYCPYTIRPSADGRYTGPNLAKARSLVAASGTTGEKVTLVGYAGIFQPQGGNYLVSVLRRLGYKVRFKNFTRDDYFSAISDPRRRIQAGIAGWLQDYPSAGNFFEPQVTCGSKNNYAQFCNRRIDREIADASSLQSTDPGAASRLWSKVDHDVVDQAPWLFMQNPLSFVLVSRRVGNYQFNPQWGVLLDQLWVR